VEENKTILTDLLTTNILVNFSLKTEEISLSCIKKKKIQFRVI